ncbi:MAG: sigma-70 family RNA polymerase sigma factor [Defluviitaleaceae bacterium]|nr:sigma-70 family RNA polymerase sigma factor [Defluviitaleaceae bacterium]
MDLNNLSDEELVKLSQSGESQAGDILLRRFKAKAAHIARPYFIMGGDRDDIVQEGMIGLYRAIREYRKGTASFATFATVCIKNQILDAVKNASRKKHSPLNSYISMDTESELAHMTDHRADPENILIHRENKLHLESTAAAALSPLEYDILTHFLDGHSYAQIATALEITKKSVDNALYRIRKKISKNL